MCSVKGECLRYDAKVFEPCPSCRRVITVDSSIHAVCRLNILILYERGDSYPGSSGRGGGALNLDGPDCAALALMESATYPCERMSAD